MQVECRVRQSHAELTADDTTMRIRWTVFQKLL